jgi:uncharacterized protein
MTQIGIMDSTYFPTVSLVREGLPHNPVRIYAGEKVGAGPKSTDQLVVFISEFQPPPNLVKPIASTMLDWAEDQRCKMLVSPEGLVIDRENVEIEGEADPGNIDVYGVACNEWMREELGKIGVNEFQEGVITGVAGVLLNEGKRRDFPVATLLAEAHPDYPDARAAAKVIEAMDRLLLHIDMDASPLYQEAERIEEQLKMIHKQTKDMKTPGQHQPSMYG